MGMLGAVAALEREVMAVESRLDSRPSLQTAVYIPIICYMVLWCCTPELKQEWVGEVACMAYIRFRIVVPIGRDRHWRG